MAELNDHFFCGFKKQQPIIQYKKLVTYNKISKLMIKY